MPFSFDSALLPLQNVVLRMEKKLQEHGKLQETARAWSNKNLKLLEVVSSACHYLLEPR
jgi:hypothetical protein